MCLKNGIKFKILQELMQETNVERPISIWKLRDAVYGEISVEGDKEKKKNKRDNQIRTVKKDVFELEAEGIVTITEMDEDGKIDNKKNIIYYNHPLSQKKLPFLIEHTFTMTATMEEKQEIIRDLITCAGVGNIKKYHCYLERFSPEYLFRQDSFFEKSHLHSYSIRNHGSVLMSMVERSMSFHLISSAVQMGNCGWLETMSRIRVCPIIRLNAWTKFRCLSREREDTVRCLNWKTRTRSWISIVM